jgi:uncharacterized protein
VLSAHNIDFIDSKLALLIKDACQIPPAIVFSILTNSCVQTHPCTSPIPAAAGIGFRHGHLEEFLTHRQPVAWLEVHSENYLVAGGGRRAALLELRQDYPFSCHGVGLSLGSPSPLIPEQLAARQHLFEWLQPGLISEHLAWSQHQGHYLNDLLPLPYTEEALKAICRNIDHAQNSFGRTILLENPSSYLSFRHSPIPEWEFLAAIAAHTGCGLLLDVNNLYVSAHNHGFDVEDYLSALPLEQVGELHVAGHHVLNWPHPQQTLYLDDHGTQVCEAVWQLTARILRQTGPKPILVEWDTNLPPLTTLLEEAQKAQNLLQNLLLFDKPPSQAHG